ncbi:MAG: hypothetical protein KTQ49_04555 [Candidatus Omnitrophica bacterium]|nr:hypothetical protein [Candidatus Omnitrophota bacterium]
MSFKKKSLTAAVAALQIDKVTVFLLASCVLPSFFHMIPWGFSVPVGAVWLPMFYAPCAAALLYRPHVGILAGLFAPGLNALLFGRPDAGLVLPLTADLVIFTAVTWRLSARIKIAAPLVAFVAAKVLTYWVFDGAHASAFSSGGWSAWLTGLALSLPGILMFVVIGLFCAWLSKEARP